MPYIFDTTIAATQFLLSFLVQYRCISLGCSDRIELAAFVVHLTEATVASGFRGDTALIAWRQMTTFRAWMHASIRTRNLTAFHAFFARFIFLENSRRK